MRGAEDVRGPELDLHDHAAVRRWIADLAVATDHAAEVAEDMLLPERERTMGHAEHVRRYHAARARTLELFEHAPDEDETPADVAG